MNNDQIQLIYDEEITLNNVSIDWNLSNFTFGQLVMRIWAINNWISLYWGPGEWNT